MFKIGDYARLSCVSVKALYLYDQIGLLKPGQTAQPFTEQLLEANFDDTQEVRYALHQGVVWGVFIAQSGKTAISARTAILSLGFSVFHHLQALAIRAVHR